MKVNVNHISTCTIFGAALGLLLFTGCGRRPNMVMDDDRTAELLADFHIAEAYSSLQGNGGAANMSVTGRDSMNKVLRQSVMLKHGVNEAEFDSTLSWYGYNLDKYEEMYELVLEKIAAKQQEYMKSARNDESAGAGLWPYSHTLRIDGQPDATSTLTFTVNGAVPKGGKLVWECKTLNANAPVDVFLAAEYPDGSVGYVNRSLIGDGKQMLSLQTDSSQSVKRVYGYLRSRQSGVLLLDSVKLVAAPFNEISYYEYHSAKRYKVAAK